VIKLRLHGICFFNDQLLELFGFVGKVLGTNRPNSLWQAMVWFHAFLSYGDDHHIVGMAAICRPI
jgi:hypothetical protein